MTANLLLEWRDQYQEAWRSVHGESIDPSAPVIVGFRSLRDWESGERAVVPQWGKGITQQAIGRIVRQRTGAAGYPIAPHDMRRSYAGMMYDLGGLETASRALRHSNLATTEIYLKKRQDAAAVAAESVGLEL